MSHFAQKKIFSMIHHTRAFIIGPQVFSHSLSHHFFFNSILLQSQGTSLRSWQHLTVSEFTMFFYLYCFAHAISSIWNIFPFFSTWKFHCFSLKTSFRSHPLICPLIPGPPDILSRSHM